MCAEFMRRAIALALENVRCARGGPFAALVAKDGKVIAEGANSVAATNDPTAHAEIVAIRAACKTLGTFQLAGSDLYTTCEPCPMCLGAIYWARPRASFMLESPPMRRTRALTTRSFTKGCTPAGIAPHSHDSAYARRVPRNFRGVEAAAKQNQILTPSCPIACRDAVAGRLGLASGCRYSPRSTRWLG